jgi:hypothetical protein
MLERLRRAALGKNGPKRLPFIESEGGDVDEPDDGRRLRAQRGHDLAAVGMPGKNRRAFLEAKHLT